MADKIGIPASRVEYVAALHVEDNKPNLHLLFWDKSQAVRPWYDFRKTASKIRADLIKYVYADDIRALGQAKTNARDAMLKDGKEWNEDKFNPFYNMSKKDFAHVKDEVVTDPAAAVGKILNRNIPNSVLDEMRVKIIQLMEKLPQTGRLAFGFLPPAVKAEVQTLAEDIITDLAIHNLDFKAEFETYKKSARDLVALYTTNMDAHDKAEKNALDDLTKRLGNQLLRHIKDIDYKQYLHGRAEFGKQRNAAMQRNTTMSLLSNLFRAARAENRQNQHRHSRPHMERVDRIEARRDARKNLEMANRGDWEQE